MIYLSLTQRTYPPDAAPASGAPIQLRPIGILVPKKKVEVKQKFNITSPLALPTGRTYNGNHVTRDTTILNELLPPRQRPSTDPCP
jgi:hypothetical protein